MADEAGVDVMESAEAANSFAMTTTADAELNMEIASDDAATDAEPVEEGDTAILAEESETEIVEEAILDAVDADGEIAAAPSIALNPTATLTIGAMSRALDLPPTITVAVTASATAPSEVGVVPVEEDSVDELQTVEPAPQPAQRTIQPLVFWTVIIGSLFLILLIVTLIIRRQL